MKNISPIKTISIVGTGNVATHLYKALSEIPTSVCGNGTHDQAIPSAPDITLVNSRTLEGLPDHSDVILIAVKDDAITEVAARVSGKASILAHTSGSIPIEALKGYAENYGVFYPLQTFSKDKELDYKEIPFFIEGSSKSAADMLTSLASLISKNVYEADSDKRKRLHIAAVFACNFANHLVGIADDILKENGMDYTMLLPLLKETIGKLYLLPPSMAQTGPAVRNDTTVMKAHEEMLTDNPEYLGIYRALSQSIIDQHANK